MVIVVMGVSGCGKTTVGKMLSASLALPYYDADTFHPEENVQKMRAGIALSDVDREPWLNELAKQISVWDKGVGAVLSCSALKEKYREKFNSSVKNIYWVFLNGSYDLIFSRLQSRVGHYMNPDLLKSQFEALEIPDYGFHVSISGSPEEITAQIINNMEATKKSFFGLIGLGVMGKSIAINIAEKNISLSVYNRAEEGEEKVVQNFLEENNKYEQLRGYNVLQTFVESLEKPRKILIMIKAGKALDQVIEQVSPYLSPGDILIDGGNSHYLDTAKRMESLAAKQIDFIGAGISGGEEGARTGPSIMPGGNLTAYRKIAPVLKAIAAKDKQGGSCCTYVGPQGAGHFVKMIHNGMEYAEMQLLADVFTILARDHTYDEISDIFEKWNQYRGFGFFIANHVLDPEKKEGDQYLLDLIVDSAGSKGTGSWSSITALTFGQASSLMTSAVFARYISTLKERRMQLAKLVKTEKSSAGKPDVISLFKAYYLAKILNHQQGFDLIRAVSDELQWKIDLSELARIWTNGCIIKSAFMEKCQTIFGHAQDLLSDRPVLDILQDNEQSIREVVQLAIAKRMSVPTLFASLDYWYAITSPRSSASIIQAQRDYFGAHTYQRTDRDQSEFFHTNWNTSC
ncbi:MAG: NADP-dependent phosphogluconate dehydrogenase [Flavobacteriaceae bacterium]|nr:NADP-dependent phosphogluconate dehydrogenase [Flavobacteriaceae bacterium]